MGFKKDLDSEVKEIEESKKDEYIKNHFATLKENLEIMNNYFIPAMKDAVIIDKIIKSKKENSGKKDINQL